MALFSSSSISSSPSAIWRLPVRRAFSAPLKYQISAVAAILFFFFAHKYVFHYTHCKINDISRAARNETLGFAKAFYISLQHRTDRQDAMSLLAATSRLKLTYQPGVNGSTMSAKAKNSDGGIIRNEQWGCWRSHANLWKRVIDEGLETALIMEDDVDWDTNVHDSFEELSRQMQRGKLRGASLTPRQQRSAPYGEFKQFPSFSQTRILITFAGLDWDVLYVGTCYNVPPSPRPKHVVYTDRNAPGRANMTDAVALELEGWGLRVKDDTHKRVLAPSYYPICTIGYAVTQRGAQRLLYNVGGVKSFGSAVDLAMTDQIKRGHLKAYTIIPPLISVWKTGGIQDSDIDDPKVKGEESKKDEKKEFGSKNIWSSARARMNETLGDQYPGTWE